MIMKMAIMANNKGNKGLITSVTDILATPLPTKRIVPTGGVHNPIQRLRTITIPKCTGCIPNSVTTGRKIGVKIRTAGVISMKVPTMSSVILIMRKITNGLLNCSNKKLVSNWGMLSKAKSQDMAIEVQIRNITMAVVLALLSRIDEKSLTLIAL